MVSRVVRCRRILPKVIELNYGVVGVVRILKILPNYTKVFGDLVQIRLNSVTTVSLVLRLVILNIFCKIMYKFGICRLGKIRKN